MSLASFLSLLVFSFVTSVTPGPNNIMLLSSGVLYGFRRTLPHIFGIGFGFLSLLLAVGLGLSLIIERYPILFVLIKFLGCFYMLYLAYCIATVSPSKLSTSNDSSRPLYFHEAALFQWINAKAWVMAIVAMSVYTADGSYITNVMIVAIIFCLVNLPSVGLWVEFGVLLRRFLQDPLKLKIFNYFMALLLVLSLWPILMTEVITPCHPH